MGLYLRSTFMVFKHKNDKTLLEQFSKEIFIFVEQELDEARKLSFLRSLLLYIFQAFRFEQKDFQAYTKKLPKMIATVAGSLYERLIHEGMKKGMEKGMEKVMELERMVSQLEEKVNLLSKFIFKNFDEETAAEFSGLELSFVREFTKGYSEEKITALLTGIAQARQLTDAQTVVKFLAVQLHEYGFSVTALGTYFKRPADEIKKMLP